MIKLRHQPGRAFYLILARNCLPKVSLKWFADDIAKSCSMEDRGFSSRSKSNAKEGHEKENILESIGFPIISSLRFQFITSLRYGVSWNFAVNNFEQRGHAIIRE